MNNKRLLIKLSPGDNHLVNILGSIDDKIENLTIINEKLVNYSNQLFSQSFSNKNDNIVKLGIVVSHSNTGADAIQKAPIVDYDTGIKCARVGDFSNNRPISNWGYCKINEHDYKQYKLKQDDILITRTATLGLNKFIDEDSDAVYNNGLIRIKIDKTKALPRFIYKLINTKDYYDYIAGIEGGSSTRPNMKINFLLDYKFNLPTLEQQREYDEKYKILRKIEIDNHKKIEKLNQLKQLYLKKFFG
jgi:type I restriction enzyme S subunit